jgi:DNA-directed RNA polymerase specialized sigma24 family protein
MSWLYNHREQLDGYQLYAEIAYRFRPKVLPADRDDIEMEITLKLKIEADRHTEVTMGFLYAVARNVVRTYWRKKYRERRRFCALYQGDKGEMVASSRKLIAPAPDIDSQLDAIAMLKNLPERMLKAGHYKV